MGLSSPAPSPVKRRWTRRSLRRQRSPSAHSHTAQRMSQQEEAEKLLRDTEDELRLRLEAITNRSRSLTPPIYSLLYIVSECRTFWAVSFPVFHK